MDSTSVTILIVMSILWWIASISLVSEEINKMQREAERYGERSTLILRLSQRRVWVVLMLVFAPVLLLLVLVAGLLYMIWEFFEMIVSETIPDIVDSLKRAD